jgi:hypothetical protein
MNRSHLTLILAGLALSVPAHAAFAPVKIPALTVLPISLSGAASAPMTASLTAAPLAPSLPAISFPSPSLPVNFPRNLPGAWNHLPVELPAEAAVPVPQPAHDTYHLDWSFLDGGHDVAHVASPVGPAPQPLPPAGAGAQLAYAADTLAQGIQAVEDALFDHALAHPRLTVK